VTYDTLRLIHIVFAVLAALMLLASVVIFIALDIPRAIGSVTGGAAKRGVSEIRTRIARGEAKRADRVEQPTPRRALGGNVTTALAATEKSRGEAARGAALSDATAAIEPQFFEVEYDITYIHTDEVIETRRNGGVKKSE
jgi:hypothetical protein